MMRKPGMTVGSKPGIMRKPEIMERSNPEISAENSETGTPQDISTVGIRVWVADGVAARGS